MIHILGSRNDSATTEIVARACERVFTRRQICQIDNLRDLPDSKAIVVAVAPDDGTAEIFSELVARNSKLILLGQLGPQLCKLAGIEAVAAGTELREAATCEPAPVNVTTSSMAALVYTDTGLGAASPLRRRHFARFDYSDEWNNLGYGRIGAGDDRWSIAQLARNCATTVADVIVGNISVGAAVTLRDLHRGSILWFSRPVGAVDGPDWAVVESFVSSHRAADLPCRPHLRGIPHGYRAAVSMRLDCDENISSARPLFELYQSRRLPFSLAIKTGQPETSENSALLNEVFHAGGAILSHSASHAPAWGGSGEAAEREARESKEWLERRVSGLKVRYAVSPFHQNPRYVPNALASAGYEGFIGGSIACDPEYMLARGGIPPFGPSEMVSHSQSCMLHGDTMIRGDDPLRIFKQAYRLASESGEFFGYLDHPFSERYSYGWADEKSRMAAHADYLDFIGPIGEGDTLFVNEDACISFIKEKASAEIAYEDASGRYDISKIKAAGFPLSIGFQGQQLEARHD